MSKTIFTVVENCVACKSCEIACAVEHSCSKTLAGAILETPLPQRRITVEGVGAYSYPSRCQHCSDASCITACPTGAMQRDGNTDAVFSDHDRCIGCWMCVVVCPFGGVTADPVNKKALKCDRCPERTAKGEAPACVSACPTGALLFLTPEEFAAQRRQATAHAAVCGESTTKLNGMDILRSLKGAN
ncbi:4Fe-4S dicluster domain-containing protein [Azomonas macrocytogenes]|uniref:Carbon-monoxide dehydrogenase iron sulfur subunit n=1 Tax=Azomonas macrocytogenes TaxID=69962 RepID=A0A839T6S4_AZOMA|nr:carbon-monoxide dehydrogenase iron sulfur subunit [Azomonas macrocytogenes]